MTTIKKIILQLTAVTAVGASSANAGLAVWDFSDQPGGDNGWTAVSGAAWFAGNGVGAGQAVGGGIDGYFGGLNTGDVTRNAHDGAHVNFLYRSPTINFANVSAKDPVLELDWFGGAGNQGGAPDLANPAGVGAGVTTIEGQKGIGLLNKTTGDYDAVIYNGGNGNADKQQFTQADLINAGVSLTDDYQLDFFENDDGGWGWTRLEQVRIDENAVAAIPEPTSFSLLGLAGLLALIRRRR